MQTVEDSHIDYCLGQDKTRKATVYKRPDSWAYSVTKITVPTGMRHPARR